MKKLEQGQLGHGSRKGLISRQGQWQAWTPIWSSVVMSKSARLGLGSVFHHSETMCSRCLTASVLDCNLAGLDRLSSADLNLDMVTQRGQKAHQPFKRNLGERSSQDFDSSGWVVPMRRAATRCVSPKDLIALSNRKTSCALR